MTPTELRKLGDKHGHGWQTRLARALPVDPRTVRRWLAGKAINRGMELLIRLTFADWEGKRLRENKQRKKEKANG